MRQIFLINFILGMFLELNSHQLLLFLLIGEQYLTWRFHLELLLDTELGTLYFHFILV